MTASNTKTRKAKARVLQDSVVENIMDAIRMGPEDVRPAIMGTNGMDIRLSSAARARFPYAVECKNTEHLDLWSALEQAEVNALKEKLTPLLVFKRAKSKTYAVLEWKYFLQLAITRKGIEETKKDV